MYEDSYRHKGLRRALVSKLRKKGIRSEAVLAAIGAVPRHVFFEEALLTHAYEDKAFPIGEGQTISQPYTVAFQTELLGNVQGRRVLEIGTGSGYQACVLCEMGAKVFSIEYNEILFLQAKRRLPTLGYYPHLFHGDGSMGKGSFAPYAAILVTAASPHIPPTLTAQLDKNGCLVLPLGNQKNQHMVRISKNTQGVLKKETFAAFCFVPLRGKYGFSTH